MAEQPDLAAQLATATKNLQHLKTKIIETSKLVQLYQQCTAEKQRIDEELRLLKSRHVQTEDQLRAAQAALRASEEREIAQSVYIKQLNASLELYQSDDIQREHEYVACMRQNRVV